MQSRLRSQSKLIAEINMVPFTDVVLVLLVIFMVTTPFLFQGDFQVKLPKVAAPSPQLPETITITVTQGDKIYLDDKETSLDALAGQLADLMKQKPQALVMINADKNVSHGSVADVMSKAYVAGVTKLGIAVELDGGNNTTAVNGAPGTVK
ncbi:MAG TPA: biopolymer transporter ExbD [bacterium]|jgi:biopolymer transport protein ExbD|nr:biopolymer transporter ExbD [bacterium]